MTTKTLLEIPLFPLHSRLEPGGEIPLRIFEPRYLQLVKEMAGKTEGFGVVPILEGRDVADIPTIHRIGTLATITDFTLLPDGLLGITLRGSRPFTVEKTWVLANGLMMAQVRLLAETPEDSV